MFLEAAKENTRRLKQLGAEAVDINRKIDGECGIEHDGNIKSLEEEFDKILKDELKEISDSEPMCNN